MKTKQIFLSLLLMGGCATQNEYVSGGDYDLSSFDVCPKVEIKSEDKAIIQKAGGKDLFEIELVGYQGNCYYDKRISKNKAVVAPQFKIKRLSDTNVEDIHFSYYLQTVEGPTRFLGKKTYYATVNMIKGVQEIIYDANAGELTAPLGQYDVDVYIGLNAILADSDYKVKQGR